MTNMNHGKQTDERGVVSIFVTMIMMLVISLIVIGFAQVARRNQREALDRQLSTQAYYAAESGVNVAAKYFAANPTAAPIDTLSTGNCSGAGIVSIPLQLNSAASGGVSTTCLMVDSQPASLQANPVGQDSNIVWHVQDDAGTNFTGLTFTWAKNSSYTGTNTCSSPTGQLPQYGSWNCAFGILRVDLVDVSGLNPATLQNNSTTKTVYMLPHGLTAASTTPVASQTLTNPATIVPTTCSNTTKQCSVKLTGLTSSEYYVRVTTIYQDSDSVALTATDSLNPVGGAKFKNGQAVIDATGQAQDESRRIQVRIPLVRVDATLPIFGLQSTDTICKNLGVAPGLYANGCP